MTKDILETASGLLSRAFLEDPMFVSVQPSEPRRRRGLPPIYRACLRDAAHRGGIAFTEDGVVAWKPMRYLHLNPFEQLLRGYLAIPVHFGLEAALRLQAHENWCHARLSAHAMPDAVYVYAIGIDPPRAGHGVGSQLMRGLLECVDRQGLQCTLRTEQPKNLRFYEKLGFECVQETIVPITGLRSWFFVRPPHQASSG